MCVTEFRLLYTHSLWPNLGAACFEVCVSRPSMTQLSPSKGSSECSLQKNDWIWRTHSMIPLRPSFHARILEAKKNTTGAQLWLLALCYVLQAIDSRPKSRLRDGAQCCECYYKSYWAWGWWVQTGGGSKVSGWGRQTGNRLIRRAQKRWSGWFGWSMSVKSSGIEGKVARIWEQRKAGFTKSTGNQQH